MAENEEIVEKDVNENNVKKISLTNLIIFILSCIVLVLFVVQIAINTDDMTDVKQPSQVEIQAESDTTVEDFEYQGTQSGTMVRSK